MVATKRLLVIANLLHASPRIPGLVSRLEGWDVTVVTPPLDDGAEAQLGLPPGFRQRVRIAVTEPARDVFAPIRWVMRRSGLSADRSLTEQLKDNAPGAVGRSMVDRLMVAYQTAVAIPDTEWPWRRSAYATAAAELAGGGYDAILSSSPYPTVHRVAAALKRRYGLPWVADFRDLWSQNHNYQLPLLRRRLDAAIERATLQNADLLTTISAPLAAKLRELHGDRVRVVRNGFLPQPIEPVSLPDDVFTMVYTGTIYEGKQDITRVLDALASEIAGGSIDRDRFRLDFYGRYNNQLERAIESRGLQAVARQRGTIDRAEVRGRQRRAHALLLLLWEDPEEKGIFPLKFFEYLDSYRPIIATGGYPGDEVCEILEATRSGTWHQTTAEIAAVLGRLFAEFKEQGRVSYAGDAGEIAKFSYQGAAGALADVLDEVSGARAGA